MRDTFLTISYKNGYVTTCYDRDLKREVVQVHGCIINGREYSNREVKSVCAAKCTITRRATK